ncbi:hypothetical protein [Myceligenerans cantabricum]
MSASALTTMATAFLSIGVVGHLLLAMARKRRRQAHLQVLHQHLTSTVSEASLELPRSELAQFHASIEIMDALAVLSRFSDVDDVGRVRAVVGDAPREVHLAFQIDIARPDAAWTTRRTAATTGGPGSRTTTPCADSVERFGTRPPASPAVAWSSRWSAPDRRSRRRPTAVQAALGARGRVGL